MEKQNRRELRKIKNMKITFGILIAVMVCATLVFIGSTVFSDIKTAKAEETESTPKTSLNAKVKSFYMSSLQDGIAPFDTKDPKDFPTAPDRSNRPGNDASDSNRIIRSYDTIFYNFSYTTELKDTNKPVEKKGFMWYECVLPLTKDQAIFDVTKTSWMGEEVGSEEDLEQSAVGGYVIEELEEDGKVKQRLIGKVLLTAEDENGTKISAFPGEGSFYIAVSVLRMYEGDYVTPEYFALWLDGNEESEKKKITSEGELGDEKNLTVKVTSELRMNIVLSTINEGTKYADFNFSSGNAETVESTYNTCPALDSDAGVVYGTIRVSGITLQIRNDNNADGRNNLKGCELPSGDISFDLTFENVEYTYTNESGKLETVSLFVGDGRETDNAHFKPLVWSFDLNLYSSIPHQQDGREVNNISRPSAMNAAAYPFSRTGSVVVPEKSSYILENGEAGGGLKYLSGGGVWRAVRQVNDISTTDVDESMTLKVTVRDYYPYPKGSTTPLNYFTHYPSWPNFGGVKQYFDPRDYNAENPLGSINVACFTAGELHTVVPITVPDADSSYDKDKDGKVTLAERYGNGTLKWGLRVSEIYSSGSQNPNDSEIRPREQIVPDPEENDDYAPSSVDISAGNGGAYSSFIRYNAPSAGAYKDILAGGNDRGWNYTGLDLLPVGQDTVTIGSHNYSIGVTAALTKKSPSRDAVAYAANILVKIDDKAFDVKSMGSEMPKNGERKFLYAAKPNGDGWDSDEEMNYTKMDELVYYESLEAMKVAGEKAGKEIVCVGALMEYRNPKPVIDGSNEFIRSCVYLDAKDDYGLVGNVYQTVYHSVVWTMNDLGIDPVNDSEETIRSKFPNSLATQEGSQTEVDWPNGTEAPCVKDAEGNYVLKEYQKTVYDGYIAVGGHADEGQINYTIGDSVRIIGNKATVKKTVTDIDSNGSVKDTYNLNDGQTTVNYKITPAVKYGTDGDLGVENKTTVTVVDTIPQGLIYNNDYKLSENNENYISCSVDVKINADRSTTVTWEFTGVTVGKEMPEITYSCEISRNPEDSAAFNTSLENEVTIDVPGGLPIDDFYGNVAKEGIEVTGLTQLSFFKSADKQIYEVGEDMAWNMYVSNNAETSYYDEVWLDVLPYNGDGYGSDFDFPLYVKGWTIYGSGAPTSYQAWEAYYTTDESVRTKEASSFTADGIRTDSETWHKLTLTFDGTTGKVSGLPQKGETQPTALVVIGDLKEKELYKSQVVVNTNDDNLSKPGDILVNRLSRGDLSVPGTVRVAARSLSGLVWWDEDFDGLRNGEEGTITTGVKVTLMQLNANGEYEPFMKDGKPLTVSRRPSGLRKTNWQLNSLAHRSTWLRSDLQLQPALK